MIGIIGAMEVEVKTLKAMIENPKTKKVSGIEFVSGKIYNKDVVVASCGIGKVFAAIAAEAMILTYSPKLIINSGVAGSTDARLGIADVAVADDVVQHDMDTTAFGDPPGLISGINIVHIPSTKAAAKRLSACVEALGINCVRGTIVSGDKFVSTIEEKSALAEKFGAVACEMEGASIGHVCYVNNVNFAVIRAISDSLSDGSEMEYSEFLNIASKNSVEVIKKFISEEA